MTLRLTKKICSPLDHFCLELWRLRQPCDHFSGWGCRHPWQRLTAQWRQSSGFSSWWGWRWCWRWDSVLLRMIFVWHRLFDWALHWRELDHFFQDRIFVFSMNQSEVRVLHEKERCYFQRKGAWCASICIFKPGSSKYIVKNVTNCLIYSGPFHKICSSQLFYCNYTMKLDV